MASQISLEKAKPSNLKRLTFLPRIGITVDFAGKQFIYRQAPIVETLVNLIDRGFNFKNLINVSVEQLNEINLSAVKLDESEQNTEVHSKN